MSASEHFARIEAWLERVQADCGLCPPSTDSVPDCLASLYEVHNGQDGPVNLFESFRFLNARDAASEKTAMDELARAEGWDAEWWSSEWFPFAADGAGQLLVVDASTGNVLEFVHDDSVRRALGESLDAFVGHVADDCESGALHLDPISGIVHERWARQAPPQAAPRRVHDMDQMPKWWFWPLMLAIIVGIVAFALAT